jgi:hypothetical protein
MEHVELGGLVSVLELGMKRQTHLDVEKHDSSKVGGKASTSFMHLYDKHLIRFTPSFRLTV